MEWIKKHGPIHHS